MTGVDKDLVGYRPEAGKLDNNGYEIEDRESKTIVFCVDVEHAERMRQALISENKDLWTNCYHIVTG